MSSGNYDKDFGIYYRCWTDKNSKAPGNLFVYDCFKTDIKEYSFYGACCVCGKPGIFPVSRDQWGSYWCLTPSSLNYCEKHYKKFMDELEEWRNIHYYN